MVLVVLVAIAMATVAFPQPALAHEEDEYLFDGSGWGHSIGMSQYGAYGLALDEVEYQAIIDHYYDGVTIETLETVASAGHIATDHPLLTGPTPVWVGVRQSETAVEITPEGGEFEMCQELDGGQTCVALGWVDGAAETYRVESVDTEDGPGCLVTNMTAEEGEEPPVGVGECNLTISWGAEGQAVRLALDGETCTQTGSVGRECFGRGTLQIRSDHVTEGFHVALELGVEEYLYGLGEMPSSWPTEALKAQAVAGRTFVNRRVLTREHPELASATDPGLTDARKASCWCHLYSTSVDQNYVGHAKESDTEYSSRWIEAVDATMGEIVTHPAAAEGTVILAFYHSSSGGHTETNEAVWSTPALAYLQPVSDPWSNEESVTNPFTEWTITATAGELASELGWDDVTHVTQIAPAPNGQFEFRGTLDGESVTELRSAGWLYGAIGARSPHFESVSVERFRPFLDMDGTGHGDAIYAVWEAGISLGCGDDYYCPDELVTRAQMATFLTRALDLEPIQQGTFTDVAHTGIHMGSINAVAAAGVSLGCADNRFCPDDFVNRAQMASFMARALALGLVSDDFFTDLAGVGVHRSSINAITAEGISLGCAEDHFCPDDFVNRSQMASFLARAFVWADESETSSSEEEAVAPT